MSDKKVFGIALEVTVTDDDIWNLMVTALEGGINYWCSGVKPDPPHSGLRDDEEAWSEYMARHLLAGGALQVIDGDAPHCPVPHRLTLGNLKDGWQAWCNERVANKRPVPYSTRYGWDIDADVADCIIQTAVFGEIVYG